MTEDEEAGEAGGGGEEASAELLGSAETSSSRGALPESSASALRPEAEEFVPGCMEVGGLAPGQWSAQWQRDLGYAVIGALDRLAVVFAHQAELWEKLLAVPEGAKRRRISTSELDVEEGAGQSDAAVAALASLVARLDSTSGHTVGEVGCKVEGAGGPDETAEVAATIEDRKSEVTSAPQEESRRVPEDKWQGTTGRRLARSGVHFTLPGDRSVFDCDDPDVVVSLLSAAQREVDEADEAMVDDDEEELEPEEPHIAEPSCSRCRDARRDGRERCMICLDRMGTSSNSSRPIDYSKFDHIEDPEDDDSDDDLDTEEDEHEWLSP